MSSYDRDRRDDRGKGRDDRGRGDRGDRGDRGRYPRDEWRDSRDRPPRDRERRDDRGRMSPPPPPSRDRDRRPRDDRPRDDRGPRDGPRGPPRDSRGRGPRDRDGRDGRDRGPRDSRDSRRGDRRDPRDSRERDSRDGRRSSRDDMPPPSRVRRESAREPTRESTRERTRDRSRSMTYEAPPIDPMAPIEKILCQACAEEPATCVCYNCSENGAVYCDPCYEAVHSDPSMAGHTNKGPLLRCKRGDCSQKKAEYWCSICTDVCSDCATKHCSNHRDAEAVLTGAGAKNEMMLNQQRQVAKHGDSDSESESDSGSASESESSSSETTESDSDELVQTWGRDKVPAAKPTKTTRMLRAPWESAGLPPNPKAGHKLPDGRRVGHPPLPHTYTCDYCRASINFMSQRYRCTKCVDPFYNLCQSCFGTVKHKHDEMLYIMGFNLQVVTLPSAVKRNLANSRSDERDRSDRPDSRCYICGDAGHFAKECKNRRKLEGGEATEVRIRPEEPEDGVSITQCLAITAKPELSEEQRLAKGLVDIQRLKERVVRLAKLRKRKQQRRKGIEGLEGNDKLEQTELLIGADELAPTLLKEEVQRESTPELETIADDVYAESIGAPPPRVVDGLLKFDKKDIYDAALEKPNGERVPTKPDEREWDQDFYEKFEQALSEVNDPTWESIDKIVRKMAMKNKEHHTEIMCAVETRLQSDGLKPLQKLATWFVLDALFKQAGGYFIYNVQDNLVSLVQSFLPSVQINENWRTRTRDMLRSWRDLLDKRNVDQMLSSR